MAKVDRAFNNAFDKMVFGIIKEIDDEMGDFNPRRIGKTVAKTIINSIEYLDTDSEIIMNIIDSLRIEIK